MEMIVKTIILIIAILYSCSFLVKALKRQLWKFDVLMLVVSWVLFYLLEKLWV